MLLAAGLGSRLAPMTTLLPKPAVPLLGRPLAHYAIDRLVAAGVTELAANAHHLAPEVDRVVRARFPEAVVSVEATLRGTGGGIRESLRRLEAQSGRALGRDEPVLVSNADVLFHVDLAAALRAHVGAGAYATMVLRPDPRAETFGPIEIDEAGRVRRILRAPSWSGPLSVRMFTGLSILSGAAVHDLPDVGSSIQLGFQRWLARGEVVLGVDDPAPFRDLGTPAEYLAAHLDLLSGAIPWEGVRPAERWVHPTARVEGAELGHVAVGEGAYVAPGVRLDRAVVWPGVPVHSGGTDVILTGRDRLLVSGG